MQDVREVDRVVSKCAPSGELWINTHNKQTADLQIQEQTPQTLRTASEFRNHQADYT